MAKFKLKITYTNHSGDESLEIEAENRNKAIEKCKQIKQENESMIQRIEQKGIYISRKMKNCELCLMSLKEELQVCEELLGGLGSKDDV